MSLEPILSAPWVIQIHTYAALWALLLGTVQLAGPKGTMNHRVIGWVWVILMAIVALSSFDIYGMGMLGPFSPIHGLSVFVLVLLPVAVWRARKGNIAGHRGAMIGMFVGGLIVAGIFTLLPGRVMHLAVFGN